MMEVDDRGGDGDWRSSVCDLCTSLQGGNPSTLFGSPCLSREKNPKEKSPQLGLQQPRQGPTDEAQMAAAAALARLEQKQPRARGPTSQDSIRNQGENYRGESALTGRGSQRQQWVPRRQATQWT